MVDGDSSVLSSVTTLSAHGTRDLHKVVEEIQDEFVMTSNFGKEVVLLLEVCKRPYRYRVAALRAEVVAIFLHILAHNLKYRVVHFSYCRSMEIISRQFKNVLRAIMKVSKEYLKFHDYNLEGSVENKRRWFKNLIGALDGIHIPVIVVAKDRLRYRNRKWDISTNVLGVCDTDLRFIYVLHGWEGSAGDSRVLRDALRRQNYLHIPNGKYFLVDAGYTNGPGFTNNIEDEVTTIQATEE
ncbi:uncharacterized protein LOC114416240 [Glycine soja]|uniref:uncharacterized protein LOC114416240 n=1 Tax=Glycine soja TaxID=3848 RepID=UPI00103A51EA|nr:uncharacterized protein LOC114416240 [Glycine soja]